RGHHRQKGLSPFARREEKARRPYAGMDARTNVERRAHSGIRNPGCRRVPAAPQKTGRYEAGIRGVVANGRLHNGGDRRPAPMQSAHGGAQAPSDPGHLVRGGTEVSLDAPTDYYTLALPVARSVDEICDRFEEAWRSGMSPRIEDFLAGVAEPGRPALLAE